MYAYSPKSEKSTIRIGVELLTCYIFVILVSVTRGFSSNRTNKRYCSVANYYNRNDMQVFPLSSL